MKVFASAAAGAVFLLAASVLPTAPAQAMPFGPSIGASVDNPVQLTARKKRFRRVGGVGGSIRRDLGGRGPGAGLPLGRGTSTSPGGLPTEGRGGMGR
jgi:hypothetical protein